MDRLEELLKRLEDQIQAENFSIDSTYNRGYNDAEYTALESAKEIFQELLNEIRILEEND